MLSYDDGLSSLWKTRLSVQHKHTMIDMYYDIMLFANNNMNNNAGFDYYVFRFAILASTRTS